MGIKELEKGAELMHWRNFHNVLTNDMHAGLAKEFRTRDHILQEEESLRSVPDRCFSMK